MTTSPPPVSRGVSERFPWGAPLALALAVIALCSAEFALGYVVFGGALLGHHVHERHRPGGGPRPPRGGGRLPPEAGG